MRRSSRVNANAQKLEKERAFIEKVQSQSQEGLEVRLTEARGRSVFATRVFEEGEFVTTYVGDLISQKEAIQRLTKHIGHDWGVSNHFINLLNILPPFLSYSISLPVLQGVSIRN